MGQWLIRGNNILTYRGQKEGKMKTAIIYGPTDIRVEDVDTPEIGSDDVLVQVKASGLVSHKYPIEKAKEAFEAASNVNESVKVLFTP